MKEDVVNKPYAKLLMCLDTLRPEVIKSARGFIKYPYCIPGGFYQQQWDWDGFFIACHLAGRQPPKSEYLKYWTLNFLSAVLPDGDVSACVKPEGPSPAHASLKMKPFLAQGAELGARLLNDYTWVSDYYDLIVKIATRRETSNYNEKFGLFAWDDAMQSGADNNPVVGNDKSMRNRIGACDVNVFQMREYIALCRIATVLGKEADADVFKVNAISLRMAINDKLWCGEDSSYWNIDLQTGERIKRISYSNFIPLWSGLAGMEQARDMIRVYLWNEDHMLAPHGLRSLSRSDPEYNNSSIIIPYSNWQGPVWPIANYFYFVGLMQYGFKEEAADLVRRLVELYTADIAFCGSLHENYDAETGRPLAPSASQSPTGQEGGFIGWNLLLQDMIEMLDGKSNLLELKC